jgi:hypothetical protein
MKEHLIDDFLPALSNKKSELNFVNNQMSRNKWNYQSKLQMMTTPPIYEENIQYKKIP